MEERASSLDPLNYDMTWWKSAYFHSYSQLTAEALLANASYRAFIKREGRLVGLNFHSDVWKWTVKYL